MVEALTSILWEWLKFDVFLVIQFFRHLANEITEIGEKREWYSRILSRTGENGMFYDENRSGLLFLLLFFSWCIHGTIAHSINIQFSWKMKNNMIHLRYCRSRSFTSNNGHVVNSKPRKDYINFNLWML